VWNPLPTLINEGRICKISKQTIVEKNNTNMQPLHSDFLWKPLLGKKPHTPKQELNVLFSNKLQYIYEVVVLTKTIINIQVLEKFLQHNGTFNKLALSTSKPKTWYMGIQNHKLDNALAFIKIITCA
jgi:hypothetical protein